MIAEFAGTWENIAYILIIFTIYCIVSNVGERFEWIWEGTSIGIDGERSAFE